MGRQVGHQVFDHADGANAVEPPGVYSGNHGGRYSRAGVSTDASHRGGKKSAWARGTAWEVGRVMYYEVVPFHPTHLGPLVSGLGFQARQMEARGHRPRAWARWLITRASRVDVALVNGRPVAAWGIVGSLASREVDVWLMISDDVRRHRFHVVRAARWFLTWALEFVDGVNTIVLSTDFRARRFLEFLGFEVSQTETLDQDGVAYFRARIGRHGH